MTRDELVAIAHRMDRADVTEAELDELLSQLMEELPHSEIVTLLFEPQRYLSEEEAIDEALRREAAWRARSS